MFNLTNFGVINIHLCLLKFTYGLWLGCRQKNEGTPLIEFNDQIACAWMKILDRVCVCVCVVFLCMCVYTSSGQAKLLKVLLWPMQTTTWTYLPLARGAPNVLHPWCRALAFKLSFMCNARRKLGRLRMTQFWSIRLCLVARPCIDMKLL